MRTVGWGLRLGALAALSGVAYVAWLVAPLGDSISLGQWRLAGLVAAMCVGAIGVPALRSWVGAGLAVTTGLVGGGAFATGWHNDVTIGWLDAVVAGVTNQGVDFLLPGAAAAFVGAFAMQRLLRRQPPRP